MINKEVQIQSGKINRQKDVNLDNFEGNARRVLK